MRWVSAFTLCTCLCTCDMFKFFDTYRVTILICLKFASSTLISIWAHGLQIVPTPEYDVMDIVHLSVCSFLHHSWSCTISHLHSPYQIPHSSHSHSHASKLHLFVIPYPFFSFHWAHPTDYSFPHTKGILYTVCLTYQPLPCPSTTPRHQFQHSAMSLPISRTLPSSMSRLSH